MGKKPGLPELSSLELEIMDLVWSLGECSSADVIEASRDRRPLADTTIRTVLTNIRKKGYLELVPSVQRGFRLRPTVSREQIARRSLKKLVGQFFKDAPQEAIAYLIDDADLSDDELSEVRRIIERVGDEE